MNPQQKNHACPLPRTNHACPPQSNHTHPPGATMHHPSEQPCTTSPPGSNTHTSPWEQPCMAPRSNHARPLPVNRITDAWENITFANYVCRAVISQVNSGFLQRRYVLNFYTHSRGPIRTMANCTKRLFLHLATFALDSLVVTSFNKYRTVLANIDLNDLLI